jgi:hypothetical protein
MRNVKEAIAFAAKSPYKIWQEWEAIPVCPLRISETAHEFPYKQV